MKNYIISLIFLLGHFGLRAQNTVAHQIFDKYEDKKGVTSVLISEYAFQMLADVSDEEDKDFQELTSMISGLRILTAEDSSFSGALNNELKSAFNFKSSGYKPLMTVKDDGENVLFYVREQNKKISEFVLLVLDPTDPVMILIEGENIDLKKLKNLSKKTHIDVLKPIDQLSN